MLEARPCPPLTSNVSSATRANNLQTASSTDGSKFCNPVLVFNTRFFGMLVDPYPVLHQHMDIKKQEFSKENAWSPLEDVVTMFRLSIRSRAIQATER